MPWKQRMLKFNKKQWVILCATTLSLSGCALFSDNDGREDIDDSYLQSQQDRDLQLPGRTTEIQQHDLYRIPEGAVIVNRQPKGQALGLEPPQLLLAMGDGVREDNNAAYPTVWLRGSSSRLKQLFQEFAQSNGFQATAINRNNLTTDWISDEMEGIGQALGAYNIDGQRFRFDLSMVAESANEFGLQSKAIDSQQNIDGQWVNIENSNRVAKQFLNQFIGYYDGVVSTEARERVMADAVIDTRLGTNANGNIAIVTNRSPQDVWQKTPAVLDSLNVIMTDRDQKTDTFYFKVEEEAGLFTSLFTNTRDPKIDIAPGDYRLEIKAHNGGTALTFMDNEGNELAPNIVGAIYPEFAAAYRSREIR